jgi:hypothetical protein
VEFHLAGPGREERVDGRFELVSRASVTIGSQEKIRVIAEAGITGDPVRSVK